MKLFSSLLLSLLLVSLPLSVIAADLPGGTSSESVKITADRLEADDAARTMVFAGNAVARQGDVSIASDQLTIEYLAEDRQVKQIVAEGNVKIVQGARTATGQRAVYDKQNEQIVLSGSPVVSEGPNSVRGDEIVLFMDGRRSLVKGGAGGRVQAVFQPGSGADD